MWEGISMIIACSLMIISSIIKNITGNVIFDYLWIIFFAIWFIAFILSVISLVKSHKEIKRLERRNEIIQVINEILNEALIILEIEKSNRKVK